MMEYRKSSLLRTENLQNTEYACKIDIMDTAIQTNRTSDTVTRASFEFLSRMSHDIRVPLNVIIGVTHLASELPSSPQMKTYLSKIDTSSKFLLGFLNDILDMMQAESGVIELHPEPYAPAEMIRFLDMEIRPRCEAKHIKLVTESTHVNKIPFVDIPRINQVFFNLLTNAIKFTPEGGTVTFRVHAKVLENGKLQGIISVSDTGIGMSPEFQKNLFRPFMQENSGDIVENKGSGLGLAIVKRLLDFMGGTITVESAKGKGSTFTVTVEFDCVPAQQISGKPKQIKSTAADYRKLLGKHILLCEDHPLNQEIAKALLEEKGMIVDVASDGHAGLEMFKKSAPDHYDAVLMDIRMPLLDGYEATKAIRALLRHDAQVVPIIAMTADAFAEDVQKAFCAGMNAHIAKPVDPDQLYTKLVKLIFPA
jgi:CheY-like chemotaxis protein